MNLYEIIKEIEDFELEIDEETGEILNADELDKLEIDREKKIENICLKIKNKRAEETALAAEIKALQDRKIKVVKDMKRWKKWLQMNLKGEKFKTAKAVVSYRSSELVEVDDETKIPLFYMRRTVKHEPNKDAIKKAIKEGVEVAGCHIEKKQNIQIK